MEESTAEHQVIEIEQHIRQLNDDWVKAVVRGDGETLDRIMADDFFFTYPLEGDDKTQFIDDVTSGDLKIEHITREQVNVRVFGSTAVLSARDSATHAFDYQSEVLMERRYAVKENPVHEGGRIAQAGGQNRATKRRRPFRRRRLIAE